MAGISKAEREARAEVAAAEAKLQVPLFSAADVAAAERRGYFTARADASTPLNPWPATVPETYGKCLALLGALFTADRAYSAGDLQVFAQVRFALGRNKTMTRQHLEFLRAIQSRWQGVSQLQDHEARKVAQMEAAGRAHTAAAAGSAR